MPTSGTQLARRLGAALLLAGGLAAPAAAQAARTAAPAAAPAYPPAESLEGNFLAAYIAGAGRDTGAAASFYREAVKGDPRNGELVERAFVALLADGAIPEAMKAAERLSARDGANGLAQLALGVRAIKGKQWAAARQSLARGGRGAAADLTATLLTAWSYAGAGEGKRALEAIAKLKGERYYNVFRDYHAGLIADLVGDHVEAERRLKAAYDADRTTLRIVDAYARFQARTGRPDLALQAYSDFESALPRHPLVRDALAKLREGKPLQPLVASAQEGAAEVLYGLGSAGSTQGDELPAVIYLRLALHLAPEHGLALVTLADTLERMKAPDKANLAFARIPAGSPLRLNADIQIGLNLEQMGRGEEAVRHLEAAAKTYGDDIDVTAALANVLRSRKRYDEAAEIYTKAIDRVPEAQARGYWTLYYFRGTTFERAKQWGKGEADLKKALALVPENQPNGRAQVLNYLAYSWVDQNLNIDEAFRMLRQATDLAPRDGMIIDSLGWAYYRLGRYEDATRELEKAIDLKPGDPVINDHLGDAYWQMGRRLEAKFQWQHAKDSSPEPEDLAKINAKLENGLPAPERPAQADAAPVPSAPGPSSDNPPATPAEPDKNGG